MSSEPLVSSPAPVEQDERAGLRDGDEMPQADALDELAVDQAPDSALRLDDIGLDDAATVDGETADCVESHLSLLDRDATTPSHPAADAALPAVRVEEGPQKAPPSLVFESGAFEPSPVLPTFPEGLDRRWDAARERLGQVSTALVYVGFGWLFIVLSSLLWFRFVNPPFSSLTLAETLGGRVVDQEWVPLAEISPNLMRAVVASEDSRFCEHHGIDFEEVAAALSRTRNGGPRGASTISMQVAKNLFLWPAKSYVRKTVEVPLTLLIETLWPKRRIFEIYMNTAEWGPGVFGIEAAARYHFGKSARNLNEQEAALLAVALPNPIVRAAGRPGAGTLRLARMLRPRMHAASVDCVTGKRLAAKTSEAGARRAE